jgi:hypothetical protein
VKAASAGFFAGIAFWHFVGFWDFVSRIVFVEPAKPQAAFSASTKAASAGSRAAIPSFEEDRVANCTAITKVPGTGSLRYESCKSLADLALPQETIQRGDRLDIYRARTALAD